MFELSQEMIGGSFVITLVFLIISFAITLYTLYLNYRQAKVYQQMNELISVAKDIRNELIKKKKK